MWVWLKALFARGKRRLPAAALPGAVSPVVGKHEHLPIGERLRRYRGGHVTLGGEVVQSKPELRIANFLFKRGIRYVYEMDVPGATPDFFLPDHNLVIEHWGMEHSRYREKRAMKTRLYLSRGYRLVETEKKDVPNLERVLEARLRKAAPELFDRP